MAKIPVANTKAKPITLEACAASCAALFATRSLRSCSLRQIDRAHREFAPEQVEFLANVVRLYRGEAVETTNGSAARLAETFPDGTYADVAGLCKVATVADIAAQGWSLNPGRYVGVTARAADDFVFAERLVELHEELETLNAEARELEERIGENVVRLLEGVA